MRRPTTSVEPPAGNGMTKRTGLSGHDCAAQRVAAAASSAAPSARMTEMDRIRRLQVADRKAWRASPRQCARPCGSNRSGRDGRGRPRATALAGAAPGRSRAPNRACRGGGPSSGSTRRRSSGEGLARDALSSSSTRRGSGGCARPAISTVPPTRRPGRIGVTKTFLSASTTVRETIARPRRLRTGRGSRAGSRAPAARRADRAGGATRRPPPPRRASNAGSGAARLDAPAAAPSRASARTSWRTMRPPARLEGLRPSPARSGTDRRWSPGRA